MVIVMVMMMAVVVVVAVADKRSSDALIYPGKQYR